MFFLVISTFNIHAQEESLSKTLIMLDEALQNQTKYTNLKEDRIRELRLQKTSTTSLEEEYLLNNQIANEYFTYSCDSTISYVEQNVLIARQLHSSYYEKESELQLARAYAYAGLFSECYLILEKMDVQSLPQKLKTDYYSVFYRFYDTMVKYINDPKYGEKYKSLMIQYIDSVQMTKGVTDKKQLEDVYKDFMEGKNDVVIKDLTEQITTLDPHSHSYAIAASCLAYAYMAKNENPELQKIYLAKAAIVDAELAIKDHSALLNLAILLQADLDSDRAYRYIRVALDDANFYNSRHRNSVIVKAFPIIEKEYLDKISKQKRAMTWTLVCVSILAIGLLLTSIYIYKQIRVVSKARQSLKELNEKLDEANHIKEEYIGYFLNQCSIYVNKLDEYKQHIYRKIKSGQVDDLLKSMSSADNKKKDIQELYSSFDMAFLKLYPNFVDDFNKLLKDDERYKTKSNELNTELRIFALIRLGITDNKQISSFLRYSIQTIYNYRSKVKAKAKNEGEDFEENVKNIGIL